MGRGLRRVLAWTAPTRVHRPGYQGRARAPTSGRCDILSIWSSCLASGKLDDLSPKRLQPGRFATARVPDPGPARATPPPCARPSTPSGLSHSSQSFECLQQGIDQCLRYRSYELDQHTVCPLNFRSRARGRSRGSSQLGLPDAARRRRGSSGLRSSTRSCKRYNCCYCWRRPSRYPSTGRRKRPCRHWAAL